MEEIRILLQRICRRLFILELLFLWYSCNITYRSKEVYAYCGNSMLHQSSTTPAQRRPERRRSRAERSSLVCGKSRKYTYSEVIVMSLEISTRTVWKSAAVRAHESETLDVRNRFSLSRYNPRRGLYTSPRGPRTEASSRRVTRSVRAIAKLLSQSMK